MDAASQALKQLLGQSPSRAADSLAGDDRPVPHVYTFGQILNTISKTYSYRSDEALRGSHENALAMRRDCFIRSLIQERFIPTSRRKWQLEVDDIRDPFQRQVKDGLTASIKGIKRFNRMRRYLTAGAGWHGRYAAQGTWQRASSVKDPKTASPLWVYRNHQPVNGDKIQFQRDGTPAVMVNIGIAKWPTEALIYGDRAPLLRLERPEWRRDFVIHIHDVEDADYFEGDMAGRVNGVGLRDYMYWCWWMRDECLSWALDFMQKVGTMGLLIFWYEAGDKAAEAAQIQNAKEASTRTALVMPLPGGKEAKTMGVEQIAPQTGGVEALLKIIYDYFERHMERVSVGQSMSAGADKDNGMGGSGRADFAKDTKYQLLASDAENLDETLTDDLVEVAKQLNYPWADFPIRFKSIVPDPEKADKLKTTVELIANPKIAQKVALADVLELGDIRVADEGEETIGDAPLGGLLGDPNAEAAATNGKPLGGVLGNDGATANGKPLGGLLDRGPSPNGATNGKPLGGVLTYAWNPDEHPRDDEGQFVKVEELAEARGDLAKAKALRSRVTKPQERAKLNTILGTKKRSAKRMDRDATKQATAYLREAANADRAGDHARAKRMRAAGYLYHKAAGLHEDGEHDRAAIAKRVADEYASGKRQVGESKPGGSDTVTTNDATFKPGEHPRGQPGNAGQFAAGGGTHEATASTGATSKEKAKPPAKEVPPVSEGEEHTLRALIPASDRGAWPKIQDAFTSIRAALFVKLSEGGLKVSGLAPAVLDTSEDYMTMKASIYGDHDSWKDATGISWAFTQTLVKHAIGAGFAAAKLVKGGATQYAADLDDLDADALVALVVAALEAMHEALGVKADVDVEVVKELAKKRMVASD